MISATRAVVRNCRAIQTADLLVSVIVTLRYTLRSTAKDSRDTLLVRQWPAKVSEILAPTLRTARIALNSSMSSKKIYWFAAGAASMHLLGVGVTEWYVSTSSAGQAPMVWVYWAFADFPLSLLYAFLDDSFLIVHGLLGTIWWYFLTVVLARCLVALMGLKQRKSKGSVTN